MHSTNLRFSFGFFRNNKALTHGSISSLIPWFTGKYKFEQTLALFANWQSKCQTSLI